MKLSNWLQFTKERFEPVSHGILLGVSFWIHVLVYNVLPLPKESGLESHSTSLMVILALGMVFFYFSFVFTMRSKTTKWTSSSTRNGHWREGCWFTETCIWESASALPSSCSPSASVEFLVWWGYRSDCVLVVYV